MTWAEIDDVIESIRDDAEHDIEDFKRIYEALITLKAQRDALIYAAKNGIGRDLLKDVNG